MQPTAPSTAAGVGAGFSSGFDWNAPPVKVVPRPDAAGGIPDVELFGLRVPGMGLVGVAAAGAFFGLKGLLAAAVLGESVPLPQSLLLTGVLAGLRPCTCHGVS